MNKFVFLTFISILISINRLYAYTTGYDYLGIWCYVDVEVTDKNTNDLVFSIQVPPEGINPFMYNGHYEDGFDIQGSGQPYLFNLQGNTVDLHLNRKILQMETSITGFYGIFLEIYVNKWVNDFGNYFTFPAYGTTRCHYLIKLVNAEGLE